jgi:diadenosine tetraphosphate (Ap4A) HIT family hydrolase
MRRVDRDTVKRWVVEYERLWRTPGTDRLGELFTPDARYLPSPWAEPLQGLDRIADMWDAERDGPEEQFTMSSEIVAVDGRTAVVRVSVEYGAPEPRPWRDLWVLRFAEDGRCSSFEEWPFAPRQYDGHSARDIGTNGTGHEPSRDNQAEDDWRADRVGAALRGQNPTVMARLPGGFACIGDVQWLPGYCVLLTDDPSAERLSDLPPERQRAFLESMARLGEAVEQACRSFDAEFRRVNLEILGNTDPFLHAHVWPRYRWEPPDLVRGPVWRYPEERWTDPASQLSPAHDTLRLRITELLLAGPADDAP